MNLVWVRVPNDSRFLAPQGVAMASNMTIDDLVEESKKVFGMQTVLGGRLFRVTENDVYELSGEMNAVELGLRNGDPLDLVFDKE
ncbi:hypothetical protein [Alicyclobacillus fastidiosus]|uniref:Ubiquitin-like domain-containing protein n=1 Tax=Alicyclobacillus fastidiosus TaxID=392011 RepID=A0ABV5AJB7_9BACL|nr:hypothetical protein [Alicyclobacillus fastidiosus]WEH08376.1 hypothetical protein PYS47_16995 [Alicyclobacillus fastidiosus]